MIELAVEELEIGATAAIASIEDPLTLAFMGNETEVFASVDQRYVVKRKADVAGDRRTALMHARLMRHAAERFATALGVEHSIPNAYVVTDDGPGRVQVLVIQPFVAAAQPLDRVDYGRLSAADRRTSADQLVEIVARSLQFYRRTGQMPDLYGRSSRGRADRARRNAPAMLPRRLWSFMVERNLLRSHNLLLTDGPDRRILLVDYDFVWRGWLYRKVYYAVRWLLFIRDRAWISWLRSGRPVPRA